MSGVVNIRKNNLIKNLLQETGMMQCKSQLSPMSPSYDLNMKTDPFSSDEIDR